MSGHARKLLTEEGQTNRRPKRQVLYMILRTPIVVTGVCRAYAKKQDENKQWTDETAGRVTMNYDAPHGPLHHCTAEFKDREVERICQSDPVAVVAVYATPNATEP